MNAMADLVGAVRLPTGAHQRAAGTQVITDLLIFRRRIGYLEAFKEYAGVEREQLLDPAAAFGLLRDPTLRRAVDEQTIA